MMAMQLSEAAQVLSAQRTGADLAFRGVSTDSRQPMPGALFFALQGPHFDGHAYVEAAAAPCARAASMRGLKSATQARSHAMPLRSA